MNPTTAAFELRSGAAVFYFRQRSGPCAVRAASEGRKREKEQRFEAGCGVPAYGRKGRANGLTVPMVPADSETGISGPHMATAPMPSEVCPPAESLPSGRRMDKKQKGLPESRVRENFFGEKRFKQGGDRDRLLLRWLTLKITRGFWATPENRERP